MGGGRESGLSSRDNGWDGRVEDVVAAGALVVGGVVVAAALPVVPEQYAAKIGHQDLLTGR
jgi:hypothetical protein